MLTCKQTSRLVSEGLDRKLRLQERIGVRLHLWICKRCRRFERQLRFLRRVLRVGAYEGSFPVEKPLPPEVAERIRRVLRDRGSDDTH
ncbi:MAG: zf-HC2 domain-containing protein [Gammaproteobacteria bacterium]